MDNLSPTSDRYPAQRQRNASAGSLRVIATFMAILACAGCWGERFRTAEVTGTITLQGRPATGVLVQFSPPDGYREGLPSAYGITDTGGRYQLVRPGGKTGAVVGKNVVSFSTTEGESGPAAAAPAAVLGEKSFDVHVKPGTNTLDFTL